MASAKTVFERIKERSAKPEFMTLEDYLKLCKTDTGCYATAAERLLKAIGEPVVTNTGRDAPPRTARIFQNRVVKTFPAFHDFYGIESSVEEAYDFFLSASQGLEEKKQILYFLGPVGSAKSSLAERLKDLMETQPIYVLAVQRLDKGKPVPDAYDLSPLYESPLGIFPKDESGTMEKTYGIPARLFTGICSPWATKRLQEFEGDARQFFVAKLFPSRLREIGIAKVEPGDENNQDISALVGKVDVRMLEDFAVNDPDAYSYSGGLCKASQGILEFVEMFKAPIKTLHPLLTATQEQNFLGTEAIGAMPFNGIIIAHSNESEWDKFRGDPRNEAFLDRVRIVRVKYNLRLSEEQLIYEKLLAGSALKSIPVAPFSLELLSRVVVASRLKPSTKQGVQGHKELKARIYDGQDIRDEVPNAPTLHNLLEEVEGQDEGMDGISTRTAFKIISRAANTGEEIALDPVQLYNVAKSALQATFGADAKEHLTFLDGQVKGWLATKLGDMIRESLLEDYDAFAQTRFERYCDQAAIFLDPNTGVYQDPDTQQMVDKAQLERLLQEIEVPAKIPNAKDFRNDVVRWVMKYRMDHKGELPRWNVYEPMKRVIKALVEKHTSDLLPLISFGPKRDKEMEEKHAAFLSRMKNRGFTEVQVRRIVAWYENLKASS